MIRSHSATAVPYGPGSFDQFVLDHLRWADGSGVQAVFDRWADGRPAGQTFLDHLIDRGAVDRVAARAVVLAWQGEFDGRDARQLFDADAVRKAVARLAPPAGPVAPVAADQPYREIGAFVGRYRIKGVLGRGGFGPVYLGVHPTLRVSVALKPAGGGGAVRDALRAEAVRQAAVHHANVVRVWDFEDGDDPVLVLEYVPGESLRDRLADGPLDRRAAFTLLVQVAAGLRAAHRAGVTHHDVNPANVLLTPENGFKLGDFGLARCRRKFSRVAAPADPRPDQLAAGTWAYTAPEQFGPSADHRADIYSLGMTVYHALAGRPAVPEVGPDAALRRHARADWEPLHRAAPGVGWDVADLVARMTAADPDRRFAGYDDLIRAAERAFDLRLDLY